ncbi:MAG: hypothetical protein WA398_06545 [Nitrososphaeraceae archaeon]
MFKTVSVWISVPNYTFKYTCKSIHKLYPVFVIVDYYGEEKKRVRSKWGSMIIQEVLHEEPELFTTIGFTLISRG